MRQIVAYGVRSDPHLVLTARALQSRGRELWCFDPTSAGSCAFTSVLGSAEAHLEVVSILSGGSRRVSVEDAVVWVRNKADPGPVHGPTTQEIHVRVTERCAFLRGLLYGLGVHHFNSLESIHRNEEKVFQLATAARLGLPLPTTAVTNCKRLISSHMERDGRGIVKPIRMSWVPGVVGKGTPGYRLMTSGVTLAEIEGAEESAIASIPAIYQERIDADFECRAIVTRHASLFYRVDIPDEARGAADLRLYHDRCGISQIQPPDDIAAKLKLYLSEAGLAYGVFDLIVTRSSEWFFLECNADGQWAWLTPGCDAIADAFADLAAREAG